MVSLRKALAFLRGASFWGSVDKYDANQPRDDVGQWSDPPGVPAVREGDSRVHFMQTSGRGEDSQRELRSILKAALKIPHVKALLDKIPLNHLVREPREGSRGCYSPSMKYVKLNAYPRERPQQTFTPGKLKTVSRGLDDKTYEAATLVHELGHHLMFQVPGVEDMAKSAFQAMKGRRAPKGRPFTAISKYAEKNHREYFAECFAAHAYKPDELKAYDPAGHAMIEAAIKKAGIG